MASDPAAPRRRPTVRGAGGQGYSLPGEGSSVVISAITGGVLLAFWWLATHLGWIRICFADAGEDFQRLRQRDEGDIQGGKALPEHFMWEHDPRVLGVLLSALTAVPVGVAMGVSRVMRGIFDPPIEFYRPLPPLYLPLIVVIWFGIDETAKIILIYLACFAPLAMAARAGVKSVTIEQINAAYSMGASKWQVIWHVIVPAALPEILTGMRIAIGFGWTTLVAGPMVAATEGSGRWCSTRQTFAHRHRDHGHRGDWCGRTCLTSDAPHRAVAGCRGRGAV